VALEWASIAIGTPLLGNMDGSSLLRAFEIKRYIKTHVKMPSKRVSLFTRSLVVEPRGIRFPGLSERKG